MLSKRQTACVDSVPLYAACQLVFGPGHTYFIVLISREVPPGRGKGIGTYMERGGLVNGLAVVKRFGNSVVGSLENRKRSA